MIIDNLIVDRQGLRLYGLHGMKKVSPEVLKAFPGLLYHRTFADYDSLHPTTRYPEAS
jgi:hypothetical protein